MPAAVATTLVAAGLLALAPPTYADADHVTITSTPIVNWWDRVETKIDWCDDSAKAGDELIVHLPRQLTGFRPDFSADDAKGESLATATVEGNTLLIRIDETLGDGTCATAHLESVLVDGSDARGKRLDLGFTVDGEVLHNEVNVRAWRENDRAKANAWGEFRDPEDQCRTSGTGCLSWHWDSMAGPLVPGTMHGRAPAGQAFDCSEVRVHLVRLGPHGEVTSSASWPGRVMCEPTELSVALEAVPPGALARVTVPASTTPVAVGGVTYRTEFAADYGAHTDTAADTLISTTATLSARSAPDQEPASRPDEQQGIWPFVAIGVLLAGAATAVAVRRKR